MKNNNKGFTLIELLICFQLITALVFVAAWGVNLYKLTKCDFEPSYKGEVIHGIGLLGPAAIFTVWFNDK